jgi:hypothetical protein
MFWLVLLMLLYTGAALRECLLEERCMGFWQRCSAGEKTAIAPRTRAGSSGFAGGLNKHGVHS